MNAEEYIKAGQLDEARACAQDAVRKTPAEASAYSAFPVTQRAWTMGARFDATQRAPRYGSRGHGPGRDFRTGVAVRGAT